MLKFQYDYITKNENLEDLFTIILAIVDDLYQSYAPEEVKNRRNISEARCSDSEIITISIVGEMMGVDSETAWHSFVKKNYSHLFPHLCCRSRYHRRKKNLYLLTELLRAKLEKAMAEQGITLIALKPSHHKNQWGKHFRQIIFRLRRKIETVFSQLTCQMNGEKVLARSFWGLCSRVGYKIFAHNLAMVVNFCSTGCLSTASMKILIF